MRKATIIFFISMGVFFSMVLPGMCAYNHQGEQDANKFLSVYPDKAGTKLDNCALCHTGGSYVNSKGKRVSLGSCQWCHYTTAYGGTQGTPLGSFADTMNPYGNDYLSNGRSAAAVSAIENMDSDSDGYANIAEIQANRFPGNPNDDPSKTIAPYRIYSRHQLEAMQQHTEFLLMNTARSGDYYAQYTGIPMEDLLTDAGILENATGITVFSPDGFSQYHPLQEDPTPGFYNIIGTYPNAAYYYDESADVALIPAPNGWCDYSAPSCIGRHNNDAIVNPDGNKVILAYMREGAPLDSGVLTNENKLDGEGPFRVVPPQKYPSPPDQSSTSSNQHVMWPYNSTWDHNAGASTRTVTMIRVEPLPEGTTDIDILEAGWPYVDQGKVIIYGAIDGTDTDSDGILDSEEKSGNANADFDRDGVNDYADPDTARFMNGNDGRKVILHAQKGHITKVEALYDKDPAVPQTGRPAGSVCPYGAFKYEITNLNPGDRVVVTMVFPDNIPNGSTFYKITATNGWQELPIESNDGDNTITITLTDGDPVTDADGIANGVIVDPSALVLGEDVPEQPAAKSGGGGGGCFIGTVLR